MTISLRLSDEDARLIKQDAEFKKLSGSELIRQVMIERIEEEFDLKAYESAAKEYRENPETFSHEEVRKMLELD